MGQRESGGGYRLRNEEVLKVEQVEECSVDFREHLKANELGVIASQLEKLFVRALFGDT